MKQATAPAPDARRPYAWILALLCVLWVLPQLMAFSGTWDNISSQQALDTAWLNTSFTAMKTLMALAVAAFAFGLKRPRMRALYTLGTVLSVLAAAVQVLFIFFRIRQGDTAQELTMLELLQYIMQTLLILSLPLIFRGRLRMWAASAGMLLSAMYLVMLLAMMVIFHQSVSVLGYQYFAGQVEWILMLPVAVAAFNMAAARKKDEAEDPSPIEAYVESLPDEAAHKPGVTE